MSATLSHGLSDSTSRFSSQRLARFLVAKALTDFAEHSPQPVRPRFSSAFRFTGHRIALVSNHPEIRVQLTGLRCFSSRIPCFFRGGRIRSGERRAPTAGPTAGKSSGHTPYSPFLGEANPHEDGPLEHSLVFPRVIVGLLGGIHELLAGYALRGSDRQTPHGRHRYPVLHVHFRRSAYFMPEISPASAG